MANGFTQRFRGKILASNLWLGASPQFGVGSVVGYTTGANQTLGTEKVSSIVSSSATSIWNLPAPVMGVEKVVQIAQVATGVLLKAAAGTAFDPSTGTVIKSTYAMQISLVGMSSVDWAIKSVYPQSTVGVAPLSGITVSTST